MTAQPEKSAQPVQTPQTHKCMQTCHVWQRSTVEFGAEAERPDGTPFRNSRCDKMLRFGNTQRRRRRRGGSASVRNRRVRGLQGSNLTERIWYWALGTGDLAILVPCTTDSIAKCQMPNPQCPIQDQSVSSRLVAASRLSVVGTTRLWPCPTATTRSAAPNGQEPVPVKVYAPNVDT